MSPMRRVTPEDADPAAETTISPGADETTVIPPDLAATQARAYSDAVPYDDPDQPETQLAYYEQPGGRLASWGLAWGIAAAIVGVVALLAATVGLTAWALRPEPASSTALTQMVPALPMQAMVPPTVTAAPPPAVTVTAPPPVTVTQTAAAAPSRSSDSVALPPSGGTDVFTICPDGHEGVVGGHTSCAFAENVRQTFYATGMSKQFTAFSPVTGDGYTMTCVGRYPAYFSDGSTKVSTRCYGGDNAEVVIW